MAVEGDLRDIDITSVIQILCTERRRAGLVLRRRGEEGVLYFEDGEIIHALLGPLEGEEAVYQLLSWRDGNFRITDKVRSPSKSIGLKWSHLLMEGMRKIDENRREKWAPANQSSVTEALSWHDRESDAALESSLMLLLSQVEQVMTRIGERKVRRRPVLALEALCDIVNQLIAFAEEHSGAGDRQLALDPTLSKAGRKHSMARLLTTHMNRLSVQTVVNLYRTWSEDPAERRKMFREICHGMIFISEWYLEVLARQFHAAETADRWRESYSVFIRDLGLAIDRIRF